MGPYRVSKRSVYLGPDLDAAVNAYLAKTGTEFNALVRAAVAKEIGQPDLGESVKMGRPAVQTTAKAKAPVSTAKKAKAKTAKKST